MIILRLLIFFIITLSLGFMHLFFIILPLDTAYPKLSEWWSVLNILLACGELLLSGFLTCYITERFEK